MEIRPMHVLQIFDDEAQARQPARASSRMLDEPYDTGVAILHKYSDQRDRLKSAKRNALDVLNTIGLLKLLPRLIERRHRVDKKILMEIRPMHVLQIFDDEAQARQPARASSRMLDEPYDTGVAILHKYSDQRDRLKFIAECKKERFRCPEYHWPIEVVTKAY